MIQSLKLFDPIAEGSGRKIVYGHGQIDSPKLMVIGDAPDDQDAKQGRPFQGKSGQLLKAVLSSLGLTDDEVYITNVVLFQPKDDRPLTAEEVEGSTPRLLNEINSVRPQKILTCGAVPADVLGLKPSSVSILGSRGTGQVQSVEGHPIFCVPSLHPSFILRSPEHFRDFVSDVEKLIQSNGPDPHRWSFQFEAIEEVDRALQVFDLLESESRLSLDLETTGFNPFDDQMLLWGFGLLRETPEGDLQGTVFEFLHGVMEVPSVKARLKRFLAEWPGTLIIHNAKFDLQWVYHFFGLEWVKLPYVLDTMHMHSLLDERPPSGGGAHDLKTLSRIYYDFPYERIDFDHFVKKLFAGEVTDEDWEELFLYLAKDCFVTLRLSYDIEEELNRENPKFLELLRDHIMPAVMEFTKTELEGVPVSTQYLGTFRETIDGRLQAALKLLQAKAEKRGLHDEGLPFLLIEPNIRKLSRSLQGTKTAQTVDRYWAELQLLDREDTQSARSVQFRESKLKKFAGELGWYRPANEFNPNSPKQVVELLQAYGVNAKVSEKESLLFAKLHAPTDVQELIEGLIEARLLSKLRSTYIDGLLSLSEVTGLIHPKFQLNGASSGRISCSNPNLQNIPTLLGPQVRRAFVAPPGWVWAAIDYSQLELRVAAYFSKDAAMLQAYQDGRDIHREVAAAAYNVRPEEVTYGQRYAAKYIDFGVIYGRSAASLVEGWEMVEYWTKSGETPWTVQQAQTFIDNFLNQFMGLREWIRGQHRFVQKHQYVDSPLGRRRRFPLIPDRKSLGEIERKSVNSPIQGFASDICLKAFTLCSQQLDREVARPLIAVHDEIDFLIREDAIGEVVPIIRRIMSQEAPLQDMLKFVPIGVDVELGPSWGDMTEDWEVRDGHLWMNDEELGWISYLDSQEKFYGSLN